MDSASMPRDPIMTDIALVRVHLPSGAATIQGVVRHPDGGPIIAGSLLRRRPVSTGGSEVLFPATGPMRATETTDHSRWALTAPSIVEAALRQRGWEIITREEAAALLLAKGYSMRSSAQPGHVLHTDQADTATWHPHRAGPSDDLGDGPGDGLGDGDGYTQLAFAAHAIVVPDDLASLPRHAAS